MKIIIASGYHTGSHRQWAQGYAEHSAHDVSIVSLPGVFWQWRLSGGFVDLAAGIADAALREGAPDVVLATSMVDVAGLRGLLAKERVGCPIALYMHENQITYPPLGRNRTERLYGIVSWTSLLAADSVAFNSVFHRDEVLGALPGLLREMPDQRQDGLVPEVGEKCRVLPVGCDLSDLEPGAKSDPPVIVWNHRWDRDKDPAAFLRIMGEAARRGLDFEVALMGERFVKQRADHDAAVNALGDRVTVDAHADRGTYAETLGSATIVFSSAPQEFFGIAVVEAMHAGCFPILPNRLVFPERVPRDMHGRCLFDSEEEAVALLEAALSDLDRTRADGAMFQQITEDFDWRVVAPRYDEWLGSVASGH